jgi:hypothetical protein
MADYTINDSNSYRSLIKNVSVKYLLKDELVAEFKGTFILCLSIFTSIIS